jgi:hypothetical protein
MKRVLTAAFALVLALPATAGYMIGDLPDRLDAASPDEFVPCLVALADRVDLEALNVYLKAQGADRDEMHYATVTRLQQKAKDTQGAIIARLDEMVREGSVERYESFWIFNGFAVYGKPAAVYELIGRSDVDYASTIPKAKLEEPVGPVQSAPSIESIEWNIRNVNAPAVWAMGYTGAGRIVMSLDTGVDGNHPAFSARWRGVTEPVGECWLSFLGYSFPTDTYGHGTHTNGTMCGASQTTGDTVGVAPEALWIASDALMAPDDLTAEIQSFQWAADPDGDPGTTDDVPDAINCSWWEPDLDSSVQCGSHAFFDAMMAAEMAGAAIVFSAGNGYAPGPSITAPKNRNVTLYDIFCTGALNSDSTIANFSSRGPSTCGGSGSYLIKPEISAPGVNVRSANPGSGYGTSSGTSMASPHVCGTVALLRQINPTLTTEEVKDAIYVTCTDLGTAGEDNDYGMGIIDAYAAAQYVISNIGQGFVEGIVDNGTNPIQGATVTIRDLNYQTTTDASGHYISIGDSMVSHYVVCEAFAYITDSALVAFGSRDTIVQNFTLVAVPSGTLEGTVTEAANGNPISNATLTLLGTPIAPVNTNASGFYQITNVPEGSYDLEVSHPFFQDDTANVVVTSGGTTVQDFALLPQPTYTGPDAYGYYAYDYSDTQYTQAPAYDWLDISGIGTPGPTGDDSRMQVTLPFTFTYYGTNYTTGWICTNGWFSLGSDPGTSDYSNSGIPDSDGPPAMIAPLWDDLNPNDGGNIRYYDDASNNRFIVQWTGVPHWGTGGGTPETFQAVLYDPAYYPTPTGDGEIILFYNDDWDQTDNTVGIENSSETIGIQYFLDGTYGSYAASLGASTCVKFTTDPPTTGVEDDEFATVPSAFALHAAYPNPFNPATTIAFDLPASSTVRLDVYNVLGQRVATLVDGELPAGVHDILWDASSVGSGVYFARITTGENTATTKMVLLK